MCSDSKDSEIERRRYQLERDLQKIQKKKHPKDEGQKKSDYGSALKIPAEFIAPIFMGVIIGLLIDSQANVAPWGLMIFILLGFMAGVFNSIRALGDKGIHDKRREEKQKRINGKDI